MDKILLNLANIHLLEYCRQMGIDPSGSYVRKMRRGYVYGLCNQSDDRVFAQVTFKKSAVPEYWWGDAARERGMVG